AKRAWRGVIAFAMLAVSTALIGIYLARHADWTRLLSQILLVALLGYILQPYTAYRQWRQARAGILSLQLDRPEFLFNDTHSLPRSLTFNPAERFRALFVGGIACYALGGMAALLVSLPLALCAAHYSPRLDDNKVFGGGVVSLYAIAFFLPRLAAAML